MPEGSEDWLTDDQLPGLFRAADRASMAGQRYTLWWNQLRLGGAVVAAVGGAFSFMAGRFDLWGFVGLAGFLAALVAELVMLAQRPEQEWYTGRAIAESAKTLAWKYAVRGAPFDDTLPDKDARLLLAERLREVTAKAQGRVTVPTGPHAFVTEAMLALREQDLPTRRAIYLRNRVDDQRAWYERKAEANRRRAVWWQLSLVAGEIAAILIAAGRAFGIWEADWSGIMAALVAAGAAWLVLKQHSSLATAYAVTTNELGLAAEQLSTASDDDWSQAVADAEEAISREHTMWLASRNDRGH
ncbi:DUF4231 domain-containing protein [Cryptosporangium japonicum]|uniref:DUF4231 domain-containing protein n=1 Tax=Cryptosporangium japonicum TaxID=80872 RepID=UPI0031D21A11